MRQGSSILDIFKISIGPSEIYTLGAWHAAQRFLRSLEEKNEIQFVNGIKIILYGSVAKNCRAFKTDQALILGLCGSSPLTIDSIKRENKLNEVKKNRRLFLGGLFDISFDPDTDIVCLENEVLPNDALTFLAAVVDGQVSETYSLRDEQGIRTPAANLPFPIKDTGDLIRYAEKTKKKVCELVFENEKTVMPLAMIRISAKNIWTVIQESVYNGCRKPSMDYTSWITAIKSGGNSFTHILDSIGGFADAVEKENASMGRVVATPTNRTAGIVASVLQYYRVFCVDRDSDNIRFLLTAGGIGNLFKENCGDYALAIAMAAAGLTELLGGSVREVLEAAEASIEQYNQFDTNATGAIKAIMAAQKAVKKPLC